MRVSLWTGVKVSLDVAQRLAEGLAPAASPCEVPYLLSSWCFACADCSSDCQRFRVYEKVVTPPADLLAEGLACRNLISGMRKASYVSQDHQASPAE